jgi:hypothetical protein
MFLRISPVIVKLLTFFLTSQKELPVETIPTALPRSPMVKRRVLRQVFREFLVMHASIITTQQ